jgi:transcriptional regulator with XRE-family HTH domain
VEEIRDNRLGDRLRRLRRARGLTLHDVAQAVGLSHTFVSMVERGLTDISLARFRRLADFYGVRASELLLQEESHGRPHISPPQVGLLIDRGAGVTYRLLPNLEHGAQVMHVRFEGGAGFTNALSHAGADIVWVIRGEVTLDYGGESYVIPAGTCVSYEASTAHSFHNRTDAPAELLGVSTAPYW